MINEYETLVFGTFRKFGMYVIGQSFKGRNHETSIKILKNIVKETKRICVGFECRLNNKQLQYPDFTIKGDNIFIQGEIKHKEQPSKIIKEINGMLNFNSNEFWYVLDDSLNISHIRSQVTNNRVKIIATSMLNDELNKLLK